LVKKKLYRALTALLVAILAVCGAVILKNEQECRAGNLAYEEAAQTAGLLEPPEAGPASPSAPQDRQEAEPVPDPLERLAEVDLEALQAVNPDVFGWIEIPGTIISYPLLQGADNQTYLRRTWLGEANSMGSIFLESTNRRDMNDFHTIIYGHRMRSGDMFADLAKYQEEDFWREHPSVYLALEDGVRRYDVFAAYEAGVRSLVYRLDLEGREEELIQFGLDSSALDTGVIPAADEKLLTLSTCTGNGYSKRWVVQAVLREAAEK
jgi:sortase B